MAYAQEFERAHINYMAEFSLYPFLSVKVVPKHRLDLDRVLEMPEMLKMLEMDV